MAITHVSRGEYVEGKYVTFPEPRTITEYEGRVLSVYNRDYRAMSDVYTFGTFAKVLNSEGKIEEVLVNANFECDTSCGHATVDATPEVLEAKLVIDKIVAERAREAEAKYQAQIAENERNRPVVGKTMVVFKGRKVPVGTSGVVAFVKDGTSVLLKDPATWRDRKAPGIWVNASNLKAV